jgi:MoaA/NifB/PqqE/SkfB family radical SAM enzyme
MRSLPLLTLYLTERCNSRCVTCDYWRHGRRDATLADVRRLLPEFASLGTRQVLLSGGEPLLNPEWREIAGELRSQGIDLWLLTSGLSLAKHAADVAGLFEAVTVSLDGTCPETYRAIRGLHAFAQVCDGIRAAAATGIFVGLRVTVQRANYRELPRFVTLARELGAHQVSFLPVDVSNAHAFARDDLAVDDLALARDDLPRLAEALRQMRVDHAAEFASGFIAESPDKLARLHDYFAALLGEGPFPPVRCNAPEFSAVVGVDGGAAPCFFIPGPAAQEPRATLGASLRGPAMEGLRADIRAGRRRECERCVCSLWREPGEVARLRTGPGARQQA